VKSLLIIGVVAFAMTACSSKNKAMKKATTMKDKATKTMSKPTEMAKDAMDSSKKDMGAAGSTMSAGMSSSCTLGKDTRVIEVRKTSSGGCELFYNKFNEEKSVATSGYGTQYCEEVKERIQGNLAKAGFNCQ